MQVHGLTGRRGHDALEPLGLHSTATHSLHMVEQDILVSHYLKFQKYLLIDSNYKCAPKSSRCLLGHDVHSRKKIS
jgi:hypothetical protein